MANQKSPAEKAAEDREKTKRIALAFRAVFGGEDKGRTDAQRIVWAQLEAMGYRRRTTLVADASGNLCGLRGAVGEGHRMFFLQIEELVRHASAVGEQTKPEVLTEK
jgi:hypothetical protein